MFSSFRVHVAVPTFKSGGGGGGGSCPTCPPSPTPLFTHFKMTMLSKRAQLVVNKTFNMMFVFRRIILGTGQHKITATMLSDAQLQEIAN